MTDLLLPPQRRIAMLIDGDNAQPSLMDKMIAEVSKYGVVNIRRIYGDWTESTMNSWKKTLHTYAVQPIQQFRYTVGKNATDSALIIDAMDILYTSGVDGFCLVSSDSDYTKLAMRIREKNLFVMGIGQRKTPRAFVNACDTFVYTENLSDEPAGSPFGGTPFLSVPGRATPSKPGEPRPAQGSQQKKAAVQPGQPPKKAVQPQQANQKPAAPPPSSPPPAPARSGDNTLFGSAFDPDTENVTPDLETLFRRAFDMTAADNGWANLGAMGSALRQLDPAFDPRTYGHKQLGLLVKAHDDLFETRREKGKDGSAGVISVRMIRKRGGSGGGRDATPLLPRPAAALPAPADVIRYSRYELDDDDDDMPFGRSFAGDAAADQDELASLAPHDLTSPPADAPVHELVIAAEPLEPLVTSEPIPALFEAMQSVPIAAEPLVQPVAVQPAAPADDAPAPSDDAPAPAKKPRRASTPRKKKTPPAAPDAPAGSEG